MTYVRVLGAAVGATMAAGLSVGPAMAAVPLDASVFLRATSVLGAPDNVTVDDRRPPDAWTSPLQTLSAAVRAVAQSGGDSVTTHASERATWASANAGSVVVSDFGHEFNVSQPLAQIETLLQPDAGQFDWTYVFRAQGAGTFDMNFDITGRGDSLFGLGAYRLEFLAVGQSLDFFDLSSTFHGTSDPGDTEHSGSFSHALQDGVTYRVALINNNGLGTVAPNHQSATTDARFDWTIRDGAAAAVPEPATWAITILGLGMAGAALRRRAGVEKLA